MFDSICKPLVDHVFDGFNACSFAYGQTGSGKTYTIFGKVTRPLPRASHSRGIVDGKRDRDVRAVQTDDAETAGMLPRALEYAFDLASQVLTGALHMGDKRLM